jgi:hypothetical protein
MGEGSGRFENTSRVDFLYRKVSGLESEIQRLNYRSDVRFLDSMRGLE